MLGLKKKRESRIEEKITQDRKDQSEKAQFKGGTGATAEGWHEFKEPKKPNKTATFRRYREDGDAPWGIIVDWRFFKNEYDENTRQYNKPIYKMVVQYDDGNRKEYEIEWIKFAAITEIERVEIIKEEKKTVAMSQGTVTKAFRDAEGYIYSPHVGGGQVKVKGEISTQVPLLVKKDEITVTVKRENGQEFTCDSSRLNG